MLCNLCFLTVYSSDHQYFFSLIGNCRPDLPKCLNGSPLLCYWLKPFEKFCTAHIALPIVSLGTRDHTHWYSFLFVCVESVKSWSFEGLIACHPEVNKKCYFKMSVRKWWLDCGNHPKGKGDRRGGNKLKPSGDTWWSFTTREFSSSTNVDPLVKLTWWLNNWLAASVYSV